MIDLADVRSELPPSFVETIRGRPADRVSSVERERRSSLSRARRSSVSRPGRSSVNTSVEPNTSVERSTSVERTTSVEPVETTPDNHPDGDAWLRALPRLVRECAESWNLAATGAALHGECAIVIPVTGDLGDAVLKVTWPHAEAEHEHLALRAWEGRGSVRLLAADPHRWAMLLERLDGERVLSREDIDTSTHVIGGLLGELDRPALAQLSRLSSESTRWAEQVRTYGPRVLPRRIVDRAAAVFDDLGHEEGVDERLVHTDLHDANVLAAQRQPWLAIDPKPLAAVPEFGVAPLVWNRADDARQSHAIRAHLRRRVDIACDAGGLDVDRAMLWTLARCAQNAAGAAEDGIDAGNDLVSWWVTCCKAMQD